MTVCAACGHENPPGSRFCNGCGAPLAAAPERREERKVLSVVFADLVGSTARAERLDPEDVRAILAPYHARLRDELERFGGTVEKFIGDAVVAVFGAPVAHEDDPERAVRAALAIQEAVTDLNEADPALELEVRIGVHTGEALVNLSARPELGEAMVSGDVMNTAARLQSGAPPGGIVVGEPTRRAVERAIELSEHPPLEAKGKAQPVPCWLVVGARSRFGLEDDLPAAAPLVGREREVSLLADALQRVLRDERPQLLTLVGVPGIGKSRLVQELRRMVDEAPELVSWRRGRSLPYGEGVASWALGEIVKAQAGILESDGAAAAGEKLAHAVGSIVPDAAEAAWVERHLGALVGLAGAVSQPSRAEAFAARRRFLEALAEQGPAVLVFEDLHWADDDLLDFVDELTDRVDAVPLLVVCTARPELLAHRPGWGGGKPNAATVSLAPLTGDETARLLHELLQRSVLPAETQAAIVERTGGVPLFAEELARMLDAGGGAELPETLQGIMTARIDGLGPGEKALLQGAAVLGKVFWTDALGALSGLGPDELDEPLRGLERREFVRRERRSAVEGARQYVFLHALMRDVAYGQIPRAARSAKHRAAAAWIAALPADRAEDRAEVLAHHLESAISYGHAAGVGVDDLRPAAVEALTEAGDRSAALSSLQRASRLYRRAIELSGEEGPDPELELKSLLARYWAEGVSVSNLAGEMEAVIDRLVAAGKRETAARGIVALSRFKWTNQDPDVSLLHRALALVEDAGPTAARAEVLSSVGTHFAISGRAGDALPLAEEAVAIARRNGDQTAEAHALNSLGLAQDTLGRLDDGIASVEHALELALACGSVDAPRCFNNLASLYVSKGRLEDARLVYRRGREQAERLESTAYLDWVLRELPVLDYLVGAWDDALGGARACLAASEERGEAHLLDIPVISVEASIVLAREGVISPEAVDEAVERARRIGDPQTIEPALAEAALLYAEAGREDAARTLLEELCARETWPRHLFNIAAAALARARVYGDALPDRVFGRPQTGWADAARLVGAGDLGGAADALAAVGARTYEAQARLLAAERLAGADPEGARQQLDRARAFLRSVGATAALGRTDALASRLRSAAS